MFTRTCCSSAIHRSATSTTSGTRPTVSSCVAQAVDLSDLRAEHEADPLPNVHLMTGNTGSQLIVLADAIVGFQSTVMIEAMLTTKPVIYVGCDPVHDRFESGLIPIHRSGGVAI